MNRINHECFPCSNPLSWSWNETCHVVRFHSNIQIEASRLKIFKPHTIFVLWWSQIWSFSVFLRALSLATQWEQTASKAELGKWANSTLGEFEMFVKKSASTGYIELAFYFKPFAPLPSVGTKYLPLPWRISTLDIWPCGEDLRPRSLFYFFLLGLIPRKPVRLLRLLASDMLLWLTYPEASVSSYRLQMTNKGWR